MATDFYLTLPSNASMKMYPDNTLAHFITDLPLRMDLSGEWECGMMRFQYPPTWYNVRGQDTIFYLNEHDPIGHTRVLGLNMGITTVPGVLMHNVNKEHTRVYPPEPRLKGSRCHAVGHRAITT